MLLWFQASSKNLRTIALFSVADMTPRSRLLASFLGAVGLRAPEASISLAEDGDHKPNGGKEARSAAIAVLNVNRE
jgi:hypothetical protein